MTVEHIVWVTNEVGEFLFAHSRDAVDDRTSCCSPCICPTTSFYSLIREMRSMTNKLKAADQ